jgi:hypothetical protein
MFIHFSENSLLAKRKQSFWESDIRMEHGLDGLNRLHADSKNFNGCILNCKEGENASMSKHQWASLELAPTTFNLIF